MQLLNSSHMGPFLEFEEGGVMPKANIEHFVILHANNSMAWEAANENKTKRTKTRKKKISTDEYEQLALMAAYEDEEEKDLGKDEVKVNISLSEELHLIRKQRKINCGSTAILADNGWFICPVYSGMGTLNPVIAQKLPNKGGYRLIISSIPLTQFL